MDRDKLAGLSRRQLLQRAALGGAALGAVAVHLAPNTVVAAASPDDIEITGGLLTALGEDWLEIQHDNQVERFSTGGATSFWKGGETTVASLAKGDSIMIKLPASGGNATRIWSNLTRAGGKVVGVGKDGYVLRASDLHTPPGEFLLRVSERALFGNLVGYDLTGMSALLSVGDFVDVIGEQTPDGINGTLIYFYRQGQPTPPAPANKDTAGTRHLVSPDCSQWGYGGFATWFNCPTGAGKCGTCNTSNSNQAAWPAVGGTCNFTSGCENQVNLTCDSAVTVTDYCTNKSRSVAIADCGPCQNGGGGYCTSLCNNTCGDCIGNVTPIIDLTTPTFAYFYDPSQRGCFSCSALTGCV